MGLGVAIWKGPWIRLHHDVKLLAPTYIHYIYKLNRGDYMCKQKLGNLRTVYNLVHYFTFVYYLVNHMTYVKYTGMGKSRFTVVRTEKDMQVMIITIALLTQKNDTMAQCT